jgi:hypothetical protein
MSQKRRITSERKNISFKNLDCFSKNKNANIEIMMQLLKPKKMQPKYIHEGGEQYIRSIVGQKKHYLPNDFPENLGIFYYHQGEVESNNPWLIIAEMSNGKYVFIEAGSDACSGFEISADIRIYIADTYESLICMALSETQYNLYIYETTGV